MVNQEFYQCSNVVYTKYRTELLKNQINRGCVGMEKSHHFPVNSSSVDK
jgi:hypothetical protein